MPFGEFHIHVFSDLVFDFLFIRKGAGAFWVKCVRVSLLLIAIIIL